MAHQIRHLPCQNRRVQPADDTGTELQRTDTLAATDGPVEVATDGEGARGAQIGLGLIGQTLSPQLAVDHDGLGVDIVAGEVRGFELIFKTAHHLCQFDLKGFKRHRGLGRAVESTGSE